jgi:hypothetical protein
LDTLSEMFEYAKQKNSDVTIEEIWSERIHVAQLRTERIWTPDNLIWCISRRSTPPLASNSYIASKRENEGMVNESIS